MTTAEMKPMARVCGEIVEFFIQSCTGGVNTDNLVVSPTELGIASQIWDMIAPLGLCICLLYFLIDINRIMLMEGNNFTLKSLGNPLLKFGAGLAFIQYGDDIMCDLLSFGNAMVLWATNINGASVNVSDLLSELNDMINEGGFWQTIMMLLMCIVLWLTSLIVSLIIDFKMLILKFEIIFRVGFAPIALGDVFDGKQSHGLRYCKKLLACFTYGMGMILVLRMGMEIASASFLTGDKDLTNLAVQAGDMIWTTAKVIIMPVIIPLAEIGALGLVKQASNDVWGC